MFSVMYGLFSEKMLDKSEKKEYHEMKRDEKKERCDA